MRSRRLSHLILFAALLAVSMFTPSAEAVVQNRIASAAVSSTSRVPLSGTVMRRVQRAADLGAAPADKKLELMSLRFSMTAAQQADLTQLLANQLNPSSASYHVWLTPEQFGARFGLSSADIAKVSAWLTSQGFSITGTARSSTFINFSGTVAQAQQAFGTSIHSLSVDGEQHISNLTDPSLPSAIASVVTSITGLNDLKLKPHSRARGVTVDSKQPLFTQTSGTTTSHFIAPADFYTIYDFNPLSSGSFNGTGVTIAVIGQTDLTASNVLPDANITSFRAAAGLPSINLSLILVPGSPDPGISPGDVDEAHIDLEWSGAVAPGAAIVYVYSSSATGGAFQALTYAIENNIAPIISISYGGCESGIGAATLSSINQTLAQANAQGQTVISSAGDSGATDCDDSGVASEGLAVDFPSSSPFVTSAGGTMFNGDVAAPATYWTASNGANGGSAKSYIPEQPWDETDASNGLDAGGAGGGGASAFFTKPSWQMGTGTGKTPNDSSRDLPDISLNAAANHDGYLVCTQGDGIAGEPVCAANSFVSATGVANVFGGTSIVAPSFAGILALIEQKLQVGSTSAKGLGNINPILYGLANGPTYSSIFHDVITGNNAVVCSQGTPNCPTGAPIGYTAGVGYDQASGLGTIDVAALANAWSTATPTGTGGSNNGGCSPTSPTTGTANCITATTLTTSSSLCAITSGSIALTATVAGSITGTTPTGTVQFLVDNVAVGTPQPLVSGSANYSLIATAAAGVASGGHNISAAYLGDSNYAGSKGTLLASDGSLASVDVVSTTQPDFSLTPCTGSSTVLPGGVAPGVTFTITPFNGFTGAVALTATNNNLATTTTSFTVTPVNITSAAGVTTSFVITASQPSAATVRPELIPFNKQRQGRAPWYAAGSGVTFACMLLIALPRRRRWGALLAVLLSVAALTAVGCGSSSSTTTTGGGGGGGGTTPVTDAKAGTYKFTVTAVSGALVHSAQVTLVVQ